MELPAFHDEKGKCRERAPGRYCMPQAGPVPDEALPMPFIPVCGIGKGGTGIRGACPVP